MVFFGTYGHRRKRNCSQWFGLQQNHERKTKHYAEDGALTIDELSHPKEPMVLRPMVLLKSSLKRENYYW
jgi:hypothetical protein